jgi:hypothetical protein
MTSQNTKGRKKINRRPKQQGRAAAKPLPPSLYINPHGVISICLQLKPKSGTERSKKSYFRAVAISQLFEMLKETKEFI